MIAPAMFHRSRNSNAGFLFSFLMGCCWVVCAKVDPTYATILVFDAAKDTMIFENHLDHGAGGRRAFLPAPTPRCRHVAA